MTRGLVEIGEPVRSGFVALVGRPNAGKSTLVNAVVGTKVAITSDTPQTTRHRLRAVLDRHDAQLVLVDTPGLHKPHDALGEELNRSALMALADVDVVALLVDSSKDVGTGDEWVARHVAESPARKLLVVTKADLVDEERLGRQLARARKLAPFDSAVVVSATECFNVDGFVSEAIELLPIGPRYFPRDMATDQPLEVMIAEFVREKVLHHTRDEVPHSVGVSIDELEFSEKGEGLYRIFATVFVERESQKGILIGKGGEMIKRLGSEARVDLERLLGSKVFLDLRVKVKKDWRRDASQIRRFGYGEGL
ncbi:MAG: GTPase Era [Coriobacteriales bacterium]|nr:GTPase Era [Coriobacteriales bacterium]